MAVPAIQSSTTAKARPFSPGAGETPATHPEPNGSPLLWWKSIADAAMQSAGELFKLQKPEASAPTVQTMAVDETDIEPPTSLDRLLHASFARSTAGISPAALGLAYADWALHFAISPGKWQRLFERGGAQLVSQGS